MLYCFAQDNLLLDMYLAPHVRTLYTQIRNRALIQVIVPVIPEVDEERDRPSLCSCFSPSFSEGGECPWQLNIFFLVLQPLRVSRHAQDGHCF